MQLQAIKVNIITCNGLKIQGNGENHDLHAEGQFIKQKEREEP